MTIKLHYFDRRPPDVITAEAIRRHVFSDREALRALLAHPGVSSSARAVIEAQLEREGEIRTLMGEIRTLMGEK